MFSKRNALYFALVISLLWILWSQYFEHFGDPVTNFMNWIFAWNGFKPCDLCRYARILLYPIFLLALQWLIKKDYHVLDYILSFSVIGLFLEIYHYSKQKIFVASSGICDPNQPCVIIDVEYFWFITIPLLALLAFAMLILIIILAKKNAAKNIK